MTSLIVIHVENDTEIGQNHDTVKDRLHYSGDSAKLLVSATVEVEILLMNMFATFSLL